MWTGRNGENLTQDNGKNIRKSLRFHSTRVIILDKCYACNYIVHDFVKNMLYMHNMRI
jgi:hypothetical protein